MNDTRVADAAKMIAEVYKYDELGSNLHIVLDDFNISDANIRWCLDRLSSMEGPYHKVTEEQKSLEIRLAKLLLAMSKTQRGKVVRKWRELVARSGKDE